MTGQTHEEIAALSLCLRIEEQRHIEADPAHWRRRAAEFDAVPLPDVADACRNHAHLLEVLPSPGTALREQLAADLVEAAADGVQEAMTTVREGVERGARPAAQKSRLKRLEDALDVLHISERRRRAADVLALSGGLADHDRAGDQAA